MAVTTQIIVDGPRNAWIKFNGVQSDTVTFLPSSLSVGGAPDGKQVPNDLSILGWGWWAVGPSLNISWQATVNVPVVDLPHDQTSDHILDLTMFEGIPNNAGAGKTGGIVITATATPAGAWTLILNLKKKYP